MWIIFFYNCDFNEEPHLISLFFCSFNFDDEPHLVFSFATATLAMSGFVDEPYFISPRTIVASSFRVVALMKNHT